VTIEDSQELGLHYHVLSWDSGPSSLNGHLPLHYCVELGHVKELKNFRVVYNLSLTIVCNSEYFVYVRYVDGQVCFSSCW
jgi:hypothetical protein